MFCSSERCYKKLLLLPKQSTRYPWRAVRVKETRACKNHFLLLPLHEFAPSYPTPWHPPNNLMFPSHYPSAAATILNWVFHISPACALAAGCFACGSSTTCERFLHFGSRPPAPTFAPVTRRRLF
jgi:hypothetical protein